MNGRIDFVGAGPGDPDLMTYKGVLLLQQADVILVDHLVSNKIIERFANPNALIVNVGKESGNKTSMIQEEINDLLIAHALNGKRVVRLKGGDVSIFSNILSELKAITFHQIGFTIVPGISSSSGAAAYSGIPLTARGYADSVRFLTTYNYSAFTESYWRELARTDDTLVLYMAIKTLKPTLKKIIENGGGEKEMAIVEQATTARQEVSIFKVREFVNQNDTLFDLPAIVLIGKVVSLHNDFKWFVSSRIHLDHSPFVAVNKNKENEFIKKVSYVA